MKYVDAKALRQRIDIVGLARSLGIEVKNNKVRCIFHSEKTASMHFDLRTNRFKCFGCDASGDAIDTVYTRNGQRLQDGCQNLANAYAPDLISDCGDHKSINSKNKVVKPMHNNHNSSIYKKMRLLCGNLDSKSIGYLTGPERGLSASTISRFGIFSIKDFAQYNKVTYLLKNEFGLKKIKESGIYSFYRFAVENIPFVLVPFMSGNRIEYLWARRTDGISAYKTLNLKGRAVPMFNVNRLKKVKPNSRLYLCEGVFDAMIAEQYGDPAVAILGVANYNPALLDALKDYDLCLCSG